MSTDRRTGERDASQVRAQIRALERELEALEGRKPVPDHYLGRELYELLRSDPRVFDFLQAASLDGLWYWDLDDRENEWISPRFWEVLGYDASEKQHLASEWQELIHPDDLEQAMRNFEAHCADPNQPYDQTVRYRHKNGSTVWVRCRGIAIRDASGKPIRMLGAHNELTAEKEAEARASRLSGTLERRVEERTVELEDAFREKVRLQERLQRAQRLESLALLAGGVAHDFNNLLVGIIGNASLALEELPPGSALAACIRGIATAGERAAELTSQMLAYAGKGSVDVESVVINEIVSEMTHLLEAVISKKATLELELEPGLPEIEADATQLRQVIMNLITNASEALGEAPGTIRIVTRHVKIDEAFLAETELFNELVEGSYVSCEVTDSGCGMDQETRERIFDPFFSTKFAGRGLGLAAVLGIVRRHRGAIRLHSEDGSGTSFVLYFPTSSGGENSPSPPTIGDQSEASNIILIVDDEEMVRRVAQLAAERAGFPVLVAEDGRRAVEIYRRHADRIRCVLLDVTMPEMSGSETMRQLRAIRPDLPIILMSGYTELDVLKGSDDPPPAGFLRKPFTPARLVAALNAVIQ